MWHIWIKGLIKTKCRDYYDQSTNQSKHPINQSIKTSNQSLNQSINQSITQSINQSINQKNPIKAAEMGKKLKMQRWHPFNQQVGRVAERPSQSPLLHATYQCTSATAQVFCSSLLKVFRNQGTAECSNLIGILQLRAATGFCCFFFSRRYTLPSRVTRKHIPPFPGSSRRERTHWLKEVQMVGPFPLSDGWPQKCCLPSVSEKAVSMRFT